MNARLLYVMDPMCSWCWGFAPVFAALAAQAAAAGVPAQLLVGGLRAGSVQPLDAATRGYILDHWQAVAARTGQAARQPSAIASAAACAAWALGNDASRGIGTSAW